MEEEVLDKELNKFNWGAFWWSWVWGLFNSVRHWTIYVLLALFCLDILLNVINIRIGSRAILLLCMFMGLFRLGLKVYIGIIGNKLAYSAKNYETIETFNKVQRIWAIVTLCIFIFCWCAIVAAMVLPALLIR